MICCPSFLFAQKGTVKPAGHPIVPAISSSTIKKNTAPAPKDTKVKSAEVKIASPAFNKINQTPEQTVKRTVYVDAKDTISYFTGEIESLKRQVSELKRQVAIMQLQLEMQLRLIQKK